MTNEVIYRSPFAYRTIMRLLYGRYYGRRLRAIADLIPAATSVLDLCCGPGEIYHRYLRAKRINYYGLDRSEAFVEHVRSLGANADCVDLSSLRELPRADVVLMQSSLYYFLPDAGFIIDLMIASAKRRVIIMEPIRNLAASKFAPIRVVAKALSGPHSGPQWRFDEESLDQFFERYRAVVVGKHLIPGGRDKIYVLEPSPALAASYAVD